ncbi:MAG: hypothetical protein Q9Q40_10230 [Acidobacteriota bacterium]|nr:hypothetical protein [Acidobacteriota bacterium]MDQ7088739.1 hypothetical protein [Acidobacteriota bacterium]
MLRGLDGGSMAASPTLAEVLGDYLDHRRRDAARDDLVGCEMTLEVLASFFSEENADLIPGAGRWLGAQGRWMGGAPPSALLAPGLGVCLELLPYSCCLSSMLIEFIPAEVRRLVRWLAEKKVPGGRGAPSLEPVLVEQAPVYRRFAALQGALESAAAPWLTSLGEGVEGRFQVVRVAAPRVTVQVPGEGERYTFGLPRGATRLFHEGDRVAMVFARRALGWTALASSLPVGTAWMDQRLARLRQAAGTRPVLEIAPRRE